MNVRKIKVRAARGDMLVELAHERDLDTVAGSTPVERDGPGSGLAVFDAPIGRRAIQVCCDIELPEPSRLLTFAGAKSDRPIETDRRGDMYKLTSERPPKVHEVI